LRASITTPATGTARLWRQLVAPIDPAAAAEALLGLPHATARHLLAVAMATSPEADELVDGILVILRSLAVSTATRPIRCEGEIRGPVLWSETMAARSASPGAGGVYICSSPSRAYDTDENRVLVAALTRLYRAANAATLEITGPIQPPAADVHRARHNGDLVRRALEHRSLQAVTRIRPTGRMVQKARTGSKAAVFRTAVALLKRSWAETGADDLDPYLDDATRADHALAAEVVDRLHATGALTGRLAVAGGVVSGGPFTYRHPASPAVTEHRHPPGVEVDGRTVTTLDEVSTTR
jgi:hypothetical protein